MPSLSETVIVAWTKAFSLSENCVGFHFISLFKWWLVVIFKMHELFDLFDLYELKLACLV